MRGVSTRVLLTVGLLLALLLAGGVSYYASSSPDGLERVAEDQGFLDAAEEHPVGDGFFADYGFGRSDDPRVAGVDGSLVVLVLASGAVYALRRGNRRDQQDEAQPADHS